MVKYLTCCLNADLRVDFMIITSLMNNKTKVQFLYLQNEFLNPELHMLLCNSLI